MWEEGLQETVMDWRCYEKRDRRRPSGTGGAMRGETAQATVKDWKCCARTKERLHEAVRVWR